LEKTRSKAAYILSRFQLSKTWSTGISEENEKKGHLHPVEIPIKQGMVPLELLEKTRRKATYPLSIFQLSKAWLGRIIQENKKRLLTHCQIPIKQGMVSRNY